MSNAPASKMKDVLTADDVKAVLDGVKKHATEKKKKRTRARELEGDLVAEAQAGNAASFRKLVELNQGRLYAVAVGMLRDRDEAMDAVQDALIKAHRKLSTFEGNSAFSTWIHRICVNLCIDRKRSQKRRRKVGIDDVREIDLARDTLLAQADIAPRISGSNPLRNTVNRELANEIGAAMGTLSDDHRAVVLLREVEGMSYDEISEVLEIPKGTVMSRLFHARKKMQVVLRVSLGLADGAPLSTKGQKKHGRD